MHACAVGPDQRRCADAGQLRHHLRGLGVDFVRVDRDGADQAVLMDQRRRHGAGHGVYDHAPLLDGSGTRDVQELLAGVCRHRVAHWDQHALALVPAADEPTRTTQQRHRLGQQVRQQAICICFGGQPTGQAKQLLATCQAVLALDGAPRQLLM